MSGRRSSCRGAGNERDGHGNHSRGLMEDEGFGGGGSQGFPEQIAAGLRGGGTRRSPAPRRRDWTEHCTGLPAPAGDSFATLPLRIEIQRSQNSGRFAPGRNGYAYYKLVAGERWRRRRTVAGLPTSIEARSGRGPRTTRRSLGRWRRRRFFRRGSSRSWRLRDVRYGCR